MRGMVELRVRPALLEEKELLGRLMQLYLHDYSEFEGSKPDARGEFEYRYFDDYWSMPTIRFPFLIRIDGSPVGFALVRIMDNQRFSMAEFFVVRAYRRNRIGASAAKYIFEGFGGPWDVTEHPRNTPAQEFWRWLINDITGGDWRDRSNAIIAWQQFELPPGTRPWETAPA